MPDHQHLEELEKLVEDNRVAFERAMRLLNLMRERSHGESEKLDAVPEGTQQDSGGLAESLRGVERDSGLQSAATWLDLEVLARVETTSNGLPERPIASVLSQEGGRGWRATEPGTQTIRLVFAAPQSIQRIQVVFVEETVARTQEFVLRWLPSGATGYREIVRQQYVFSPAGSTTEVEDYQVDLKDLVVVELLIRPDLSGGKAFASLARWSLASLR